MRSSLFWLFVLCYLAMITACTKATTSEPQVSVLTSSAFFGGETAAKNRRPISGPPRGPQTDRCEVNQEISEESPAFMDIVVSRVCTWHYEPLFFSNAQNPIVTLETFPRYLEAGSSRDFCDERPRALAARRPIYTLINRSLGDHMSSTDANEAAESYLAEGTAYLLYTDTSACNVPLYRCWIGSGIHFDTTDPGCEGRAHVDGPMGNVCARPAPGLAALERLRNSSGAYYSSSDPAALNAHYAAGWTLDRHLGYVPELSQSDAEKGVVLASQSMRGHDFSAGRYEDYFYVDLPRLQRAFPRSWRRQPIRARICDDRNQSGSCNLANRYSTISIADLYLTAEHLPPQIDLEVYSQQIGYNPAFYHDLPEFCDRLVSPLVINLKGETIQLKGPEQGVQFDLEGSGRASATGWIAGAHDAFLVRDLDRNGHISSGAELFGSATVLKDGSLAKNGFEALRDLDDDRNGVFDPRDVAWNTLQVWRDANHNALTEEGELLGLTQAGLLSIDLAYTAMAEVDSFGNKTLQRSTFLRRVGERTVPELIVDVWFKSLVSY